MVTPNNGNGRGREFPNDAGSLRGEIFCLLGKSSTSEEQDLKVLAQCTSHIRSKMSIEKIAAALKLTLSNFRVNDALELYYDVMRGPDNLGYVSKGWEDPGFRLGEVLGVPKPKVAQLKASLRKIRHFCAVNGIAMTVRKAEGGAQVQMDGVIYIEGFNKKTFLSTLDTLHECIVKADELIG